MRIIGSISVALLFTSIAYAQAPQRQQTPEQQAAQKARADATAADHQNMLDQLKIINLRRGRDGNDPASPYHANYDESKANPFPVWPDPLTFKDGKKVTKASEWPKRRAEIEEDFSREIYGRVPKNMPRVTWKVFKDTDQVVNNIPVNFKQLVGHVDNSSYPAINVDIQLTLMVPKNAAKAVPVIMVYGGQDFLNPAPAGAFGFGGPPRAGANNQPRPKSPQEQILEKGWAYATINPGSVQADDGGGLTKGIIGLVNKGQWRKPDDWGVLRAWAWGADRALDYFETNKAVDAKKVALEGHSRWGKATLVSMAFNTRLAAAYVSSSGQGGAKPGRRDAGEVVEI
ncbi:alpha/beta hydrolase family protein [Mucilaginibacter calamicampi]|uniref:Alpha/beta hydrolase family protein n=1 Tax=Mucilaginibacter calamicampi TaxID=1302352 RepID=A0ABW2Z0A6_9SPHI